MWSVEQKNTLEEPFISDEPHDDGERKNFAQIAPTSYGSATAHIPLWIYKRSLSYELVVNPDGSHSTRAIEKTKREINSAWIAQQAQDKSQDDLFRLRFFSSHLLAPYFLMTAAALASYLVLHQSFLKIIENSFAFLFPPIVSHLLFWCHRETVTTKIPGRLNGTFCNLLGLITQDYATSYAVFGPILLAAIGLTYLNPEITNESRISLAKDFCLALNLAVVPCAASSVQRLQSNAWYAARELLKAVPNVLRCCCCIVCYGLHDLFQRRESSLAAQPKPAEKDNQSVVGFQC